MYHLIFSNLIFEFPKKIPQNVITITTRNNYTIFHNKHVILCYCFEHQLHLPSNLPNLFFNSILLHFIELALKFIKTSNLLIFFFFRLCNNYR